MLFGCSTDSERKIDGAGLRYAGFESGMNDFSGFKAAILLPLSGKAARLGIGMQNAAMLAQSEINNRNLILEFFDTKSTPEGAANAARGAVAQGAKIIIGPLLSEEVIAITPIARAENIPVVSFSTSPQVLQSGIYTLGLLSDEQIRKIIDFAYYKGRENFAMIVPDNQYGLGLAKYAYIATREKGANLIKIGFYPQDSIDFTKLLSDMTNYQSRVKTVDAMKRDAQARYEQGDESAEAELKRLEKMDSLGKLDFDAIIIPESGSKLKSATSMLGYYDVFSPEVMFLGIATWDNTNLTKETTLYGAYYPALSKQYSAYFSEKYLNLYGQYPENLYSVAYDAVSVLSALANERNQDLQDRLLDPAGFTVLSGDIRFYQSGTNKHNLKIFEVTSEGPKEVTEKQDKPKESFGFATLDFPEIYGKDVEEVKRFIFSDL